MLLNEPTKEISVRKDAINNMK